MVKERVSNKAGKHFCSSEKKWPTKVIFGLDLSEAEFDALVEEEFLILEFSIKQLFYSGLLDIK